MSEEDKGGDPQLTEEELKKITGFMPEGLNPEDPSTFTPERIAALSKTAATALGQKDHWRGKYNRDVKPPAPPQKVEVIGGPQKETPLEKGIIEDVARLKLSEEKRQFGSQHGFDAEETDKVFAYAAGMGKKPEDVLQDNFLKGAITQHRRVNRVSAGIPAPSGRRSVVEGKSFQEMNDAERRKNFAKVTGAEK